MPMHQQRAKTLVMIGIAAVVVAMIACLALTPPALKSSSGPLQMSVDKGVYVVPSENITVTVKNTSDNLTFRADLRWDPGLITGFQRLTSEGWTSISIFGTPESTSVSLGPGESMQGEYRVGNWFGVWHISPEYYLGPRGWTTPPGKYRFLSGEWYHEPDGGPVTAYAEFYFLPGPSQLW